MSNIMAVFGQDYVQTQIISENNAVKYKLSVAAGLKTSSPSGSYFLFKDNQIGQRPTINGIVIREWNTLTSTLVSYKEFTLATTEASGNSAFIQYMNSLTAKANVIVAISTEDRLYSSPLVDTWFSSVFSAVWPGSNRCSRRYCSYVAYYSVAQKKIIQEAVTYSDGRPLTYDNRAQLDIVYDKYDDIGATGYAKRSIEDYQEYTTNSIYEYKRWPLGGALLAPVADFGIRPGSKMFLTASMFADSTLIADGSGTRIALRWYRGSTYLSVVVLDVPPNLGDQWIKFNRYIDVPADVDSFSIIASRYPRKDTSTGVSSVKNLILTEIARDEESISRPAEFGVNGIRMNKAIEGKNTELLILANTLDDPSGNVRSTEFREI